MIKYKNKFLFFIFIDYFWGLGIGDWGLGPIPNPHFIFLINNNIN